jgi:kynureninase
MGSRQHLRDIKSGPPLDYQDDIRAYTREYAEALDAQDPLHQFRDEFIIPSKQDLKRKILAADQSMYIQTKPSCVPHHNTFTYSSSHRL